MASKREVEQFFRGHLRIAAAAERLGVTYRCVHNWVAAGTLPHVRVGAMILIDAADLKKFKRRSPGNPNWVAKKKNLRRK